MAMATKTLLLLFSLFGPVFSGLVGGWSNANVDDKQAKKYVNDAVTSLNAKSNSLYHMKLVEISSFRIQVVAGLKMKITFIIGMTNCDRRTTTPDQLDSCEVQQTQKCKMDVYTRSWEHYEKSTEPQCEGFGPVSKHSVKRRSALLGGEEAVEVGDEDVLAAVDYVMEDLNGRVNSLYRYMPMDLKDVTRQVVSGTKFSFTLIIGMSSCRNNGENLHAKLTKCPVDKDKANSQTCYVEMLYQSWQDRKYNINSINCQTAAELSQKTSHNANIDAKMNQIPVLGGDKHDNAHWGVFQNFKEKYNKKYESRTVVEKRFKIFRENMKKVDMLNLNELGDAEYGVTEFSDMTEEEFRRFYLTPKWDLSHRPSLAVAEIPEEDPPAAFDWRDHNAVTPVKNQGTCGSCWAFSTTGNIEGQWAVRKSKLVSLSEQELVDCDKLDDGCEGGLPVNAYEEIIRLGGLETETEYPYDGADEKCKFKVGDIRVYINSSVNISSNEGDMAAWLAKNGPISIGINAFAMQFYLGGISHPFSFLCSPDALDHGVLIVGYGVKKGWFSDSPYWIVKNSWGESWGVKGYYLVYRGDGVCGLNRMPTSAIIK